MLQISEELKQNITEIVTRIREIERVVGRMDESDSGRIAGVSCAYTEIALLAFSASDELSGLEGAEDRLLRNELSSALWQIALHCIEIQEWTAPAMLKGNVRYIGQHCSGIVRLLGIPEPVLKKS